MNPIGLQINTILTAVSARAVRSFVFMIRPRISLLAAQVLIDKTAADIVWPNAAVFCVRRIVLTDLPFFV
ncbi:MAG TPA: hypothetical protein VF492_12670 [Verrucomicrobiae bacterium]